MEVIVAPAEFLQLGLAPPHLGRLAFQLLQQLLRLRQGRPLAPSDGLLHVAALLLDGAEQLGEDPVALLLGRLGGVLGQGARTHKFILWTFALDDNIQVKYIFF